MSATTSRTTSLTRAVERLESLRAVKDLQRRLAHDGRLGDVAAMERHFSDDAVFEYGPHRARGRAEIEALLRSDLEAWPAHAPGALRFEVVDQPLVTLSTDGRTARGRWHTLGFLGDGAGRAKVRASLLEVDYLATDAGWKISRLIATPTYGGDAASGWTNANPDGLPIVPVHASADDLGAPTGRIESLLDIGDGDAVDLADRIARLNAEDDARNLQHALGYYVERNMWTDVAELFTEDGGVRTVGVDGDARTGILDWLRTMGDEGLRVGELNDRVVFDAVVEVQPGNVDALVRGFELGLLADGTPGGGHWEFTAFVTRMRREGGVWRIAELERTPMMRVAYADGWGHGGDVSATNGEQQELIGDSSVPPAGPAAPSKRYDGDASITELSELERRLRRSLAYDAVENLSAAYGYLLDDLQWADMAALFATNGNKQTPFVGYYFGRERILGAGSTNHSAWRDPAALRQRAVFHWRPQSVVAVSNDGRSAGLRTRLFQTRTAASVTPNWTGIHGGSYPNDQAVLEDGVWRLWSVTIDEYFFTSPTWSGGWASATAQDAVTYPPSVLFETYPPDLRLDEIGPRMDGFRGGSGRLIEWPEIVPMWFSYRNPVSGRTPERYLPDCVPSIVDPRTSMTAHGYELPPTGPANDEEARR
ncbi:MAG: nuclear transport factor 2 family protein [Pseudoclavibacter sp.]